MDNRTQPNEMKTTNIKGSLSFTKYKIPTALIILRSIKYEIGLKYPEYLPCLNKLKS